MSGPVDEVGLVLYHQLLVVPQAEHTNMTKGQVIVLLQKQNRDSFLFSRPKDYTTGTTFELLPATGGFQFQPQPRQQRITSIEQWTSCVSSLYVTLPGDERHPGRVLELLKYMDMVGGGAARNNGGYGWRDYEVQFSSPSGTKTRPIMGEHRCRALAVVSCWRRAEELFLFTHFKVACNARRRRSENSEIPVSLAPMAGDFNDIEVGGI